MNAQRIYKEARPLFWPWCAVVCAGALTLFHPPYPAGEISRLAFLLGIPLLATLPFGNEFQNRTFSLLLSQPGSRMEIWRQKLSIAAIVVFSAALVFFPSLRANGVPAGWETWGYAAAAAIVLVASAPFWTLFTRSIVGGVALSFGVYNLILLLGYQVLFWIRGNNRPPDSNFVSTVGGVFLVYSGFMLWLGWRTLARFQAIGDAAGSDLLTVAPDVLPKALASWLRCGPEGVTLNLIRKEIRLLRPVWLISLLAAGGWACLTLLGLLQPRGLTKSFEVAVASVGVIGTLIIAMLAGSLPLGEEGTSGTLLAQLTLPVSASRQWFIKLCTALLAAFIGAWLLPVLIAGRPLLISSNLWGDRQFGFGLLITVLLLSFAAFWCACAAKGTVPAVLWVVPVMTALFFAGEFGTRLGHVLTESFFARFDPFANQKFAHAVSRLGSYVFFKLIDGAYDNMTDSVHQKLVLTTILLFPTLLYAVIQSYRLFRTQIQERDLSVVRNLLPLVLTAFLCGLLSMAFFIFVAEAGQDPEREALFQTIGAVEKIESRTKVDAAHPLQLTVADLAKASPLSKRTRRLLGDSHITLGLDAPPHHAHYGCTENSQPSRLPAQGFSWYWATIPLPDGSQFVVTFDAVTHYTMSAGMCK